MTRNTLILFVAFVIPNCVNRYQAEQEASRWATSMGIKTKGVECVGGECGASDCTVHADDGRIIPLDCSPSDGCRIRKGHENGGTVVIMPVPMGGK